MQYVTWTRWARAKGECAGSFESRSPVPAFAEASSAGEPFAVSGKDLARMGSVRRFSQPSAVKHMAPPSR